MASVFNWMEKNWPFTSDSDFICKVEIAGATCPVIKMQINSSLSTPFEIILLVLTSNTLNSTLTEVQSDITVNFLYNNNDLAKKFKGKVVYFAYKGESFVLSSSLTNVQTSTPKNIYEVVLRPDAWNAQQKIKTCIFHKKNKSEVIQEVLKPYNTTATLTDTSNLKTKEVITQYKETDFDFSLRLMEEEGYFCFYDFSSESPLFTIKSAQTVSTGSISTISNSLQLVSDIHDNFNFNQLIDLKLTTDTISKVSDEKGLVLKKTKIDSLKKVAELVEKNNEYTKFYCESTSYNLFAGDYFTISQDSNSKSLISPLSNTHCFFIEKSILKLRYKENVGWYIRNELEGFVINGGIPTYRLERKTQAPIVTDSKKAYICGVTKNSLYVNSEGNVKIRFTWIPFQEGSKAEKEKALADAKLAQDAYIESREILAASIDNGGEKASDEINSQIDKATDSINSAASDAIDGVAPGPISTISSKASEILVDAVSSSTQTAVSAYFANLSEDYATRAEQDKMFTNTDDFLQDSTAVWSINNSDTRALSGWIPISNWGAAGNSFGNYQYPRVGQIVSVSFIEGNPDYPIVVGSSYSNLFDEYASSISASDLPDIPYAKVTQSSSVKETAGALSGSLFGQVVDQASTAATDALKSLEEEVSSLVNSPSKFLDILEGTAVPDLIPFACREVSVLGKIKDASTFETNDIQQASGNMIIKSFSYDEGLRTNRAGWNEISFFNERYNEALRISSAHYLFLHSRDIVHIMAPSLLKEQLGARMTTLSGNKYEIISGNSNYYLGGNGITFYPGSMARSSVEYNDGMAVERLSMEVAQKFMSQLSCFVGSQVIGTFANHALMAYISMFGDWVSVLFLGNYNLITLVGNINMRCVGGEYSVMANMVTFSALGGFKINAIGIFYVKTALRMNLISHGTIVLNSSNSISVEALHKLHLKAGLDCDMKVGGKIDIEALKDISIFATKKISITSEEVSIMAPKFSVTSGQFKISGLSISIQGGIVKISGAMVNLG